MVEGRAVSALDKHLHSLFPTTERDTKGKILCVFQGIGKFILLLGFLYLFVCSLDVLSSAFQLVGGKDPKAFRLEVATQTQLAHRPSHASAGLRVGEGQD